MLQPILPHAGLCSSMAKGINYEKDERPNKEGLVPLEAFQELADNHLQFMLDRDANEPLRVLAANAEAIYRGIKTNGMEAQRAAVKLARAERLQQLMAMFESSNVVDFMLIKWPAWWANDKIERRKERRILNA